MENKDFLDKENRIDEASASVKSLTPEAEATAVVAPAGDVLTRAAPVEDGPVMFLGTPILDIINTMLPNGVPANASHKAALKLASDLILLLDGNQDKVRQIIQSLPWVKDMVKERGQDELDRILQTAQKRMMKREAENYSDPQPSKDMRDAIQLVTGKSYRCGRTDSLWIIGPRNNDYFVF